MEDAADALKIAFAVFVFVIAITLLFLLISQAKSTADYVLYYNDKTNFRVPSAKGEKEVSFSEVVSTLYRYNKESISVTIILGSDSQTFDLADEIYSNEQEIEQKIGNYIVDTLSRYEDRTFTEKFVEVPISGTYITGEDGTQITLSAGASKVYVTYTLI